MGQSGRNTPLDAVLLSFSKEDAHLFAMLPLRKSTFYRSCLSLIRHTGTSIFIFRKQFLGSLHQKLFICRLPTPVRSRKHRRFQFLICRSNGNSGNQCLTGLYFREVYFQQALLRNGIYYLFACTVMATFSPYVQIIQHEGIVHHYIKYAQTFTIGRSTSPRTMPGLCKVKFDTIDSVSYRKTIFQLVTAKAEGLK